MGLIQANIKQVLHSCRYTLNVWDVGGQRTLRPYWRNYFEATDAVVWVVDSSDRLRTKDCQEELKGLLQEEVSEAEGYVDKRGGWKRSLTRLTRL
jgi:GTPase SAR1 family protein